MPTPTRFLHNEIVVHVPSEATGERFTLVECTGPAGDQPPLHVHHADDETFYVLAGRMRFWLAGGTCVEAGPGECVLAPRGIPHTYRVESPEGARWLVACAPGGFDRFVTSAGADPTPGELTALAAEIGVEILGPPGALPS